MGNPFDEGTTDVARSRGYAKSKGVRFLTRQSLVSGRHSRRWRLLCDLATHRRTVLPRALSEYNSLSFSPDGSRLAAGSEGESKLFDTASGQAVLSFKHQGLKLAFARDGERLLAVHSEGASVFHAPSFEKLQFDWLKEKPSQEVPPYLGPDPNYSRPDRP